MSNGGKGKTARKKTTAAKPKGKTATRTRARSAKPKPAKTRKPAAKRRSPETPTAADSPPRPDPEPATAGPSAESSLPDSQPEEPAWAAEPAARPAAQGESSAKAWVAAVVFLAVLGGGGYATWPLWSHLVVPVVPRGGVETIVPPAAIDRPAEPATDGATLEKLGSERAQLRDELKDLMARIESVEHAVDTVKKMIRATAPPSEKIATDSSVRELSDRLAQLEKDGGTLKSLLERVDQLEREGAGAAGATGGPAGVPDDSRARAVVLAVANLREAVNRDEPYEKALEALNAVGGDDPDVKVAIVLLQKTAATGIPTLVTLRERFQAIAGKIVQASKALEERGWLERAANRLSSLVTWRRVGDNGGGASVDAIVARAEARLKAGELKAAVDAVERLSAMPKAAAVAASWLADAKARVAAEQAVATLHVHAVSLLAPARE